MVAFFPPVSASRFISGLASSIPNAVSVPPVDLYPVIADGDLGDTLFMMTPRDFSKAEQPSGYNRYQLVVNGRGVPVWWRESPGLSFDFRVTDRGNFSLNTQLEQGVTMTSVILRPDGAEVVEQWTPSLPPEWNSVRTDAHELWVFEDGSTLQSIRGNRLEDLSGIGGLVEGRVSATGVQERDANGVVTAEWTAFDSIDLTLLPVDVLAQLNDEEPFWAAHINSVEPVDGGWILSLRSPGEVVRVDRSSGDVVWRLGGPRSDFTFVDDPRGGFFGQHSARWLGDDQLALFDNRINFDSVPVGHARMVVYQLDFDAMTASLILSHEAAGAGGADFAGLVTRLPNGDFIVGWGSTQRLGDGSKAPIATRLGPDGEALGTLTLPDDSYSYRVWPAWGDSTTGVYRNTP